MQDGYELRLGDELIAELFAIDAEFPWMWFEFIPTSSFGKVRPLFVAHERFLRHHGRIHKKIVGWKRAEKIWQKLLHEGLNFTNTQSGEKAEWFFVRLDFQSRQLDARFAFKSWEERGKQERAEALRKYADLVSD